MKKVILLMPNESPLVIKTKDHKHYSHLPNCFIIGENEDPAPYLKARFLNGKCHGIENKKDAEAKKIINKGMLFIAGAVLATLIFVILKLV